MARYHFVVLEGEQRHEDESGIALADDEGARVYATRVIRDLKQGGGYSGPEWAMVVEDDTGHELFRINFTSLN
jgi:hypothetical protein